MKTIIKTTLKGSESITVSEDVQTVFTSLMDKGGFCLFNRKTDKGERGMIIKKSVVKLVITRD